jgi:uncharacterized protein (TIGR03435 family)
MEFFAKVFLTMQAGRPVVDKTNIKGNFNFALDWTPDEREAGMPGGEGSGPQSAPESTGPSFFTALKQQLGLKLVAAKGPVEVMVVDRAEKASKN